MTLDPRLSRLDENRVRIDNPYGIDAVLFANESVPVEPAAVTELVQMLDLSRTVERFAQTSPESFETEPAVTQVAVTPDFHKARGIPVGTVLATRGFLVPQSIGNDINCGMRLHLTSLQAEDLKGRTEELDTAFRHLFFEGGRNIPMTREQRAAMLTRGLTGLLDSAPRSLTEGVWSLFHELDMEGELARVDRRGTLEAGRIFGLDDWMGPAGQLSRDSQIGSIGGGNHFVEIQRVEKILDGTTAHAWGLKPGMVTVMVHTGSVSIGHLSGGYFRDVVRNIYPPALRHPENGIFVLPQGQRFADEAGLFWDALHNAGNFAFANRLFLALTALAGLRRVCGDGVDFRLLYDAPHNFIWREERGGEEWAIHRKGSCPARGYAEMAGTPFEYFGEPVLVPGSMGASSFVMAGQGNPEALSSASHGAGRALSRGDAARGHEDEFQRFLDRFRVVSPLDLRRPDVRLRRDIVQKKLDEIKQEAPHAYKGIGPVVDTLTGAGLARPVVELTPLMTIKG